MGSSSRSSCLVRQRLPWRARVEFCEVDVSGTGSVRRSCWSPCVGSYISVIYFSKQCCNLPFCDNDGGVRLIPAFKRMNFETFQKWNGAQQAGVAVPSRCCAPYVSGLICVFINEVVIRQDCIGLEWKNDLWLMSGKRCGAKRLWLNWRPV
jgi:hypothetical protein